MNPNLNIDVQLINLNEDEYYFLFKVKCFDAISKEPSLTKYKSPSFKLKDKEKVYNETMFTIIEKTYKILFPL